MELFHFFRGLLAWMATVAIFLPISFPMAAAAYKIRHGPKPLDIDADELWYRAFLASFIFALVSVGFLLVDWFIANDLDFPPGIVHMVMVFGYVPMGMWVMTYYFGFSDLMDGLSTFTIYMLLPVGALYLANAVAPVVWTWALDLAKDWLKPVEATVTA